MPLLSLRLSDAQAERLAKEAEEFGLTKGSIVKARVFADDYKPRRIIRPDHEQLARIAGHLGKIGGNLNQVAHAINRGDIPPTADLARALSGIKSNLDEMKTELISTLHKDRKCAI